MLGPLLAGLQKVHETGFLHRDIKPANIMLGADGKPTLIDFGAARAAMADRTRTMTAIFTPGYAAPEQFTSAKQGPWTDIYGLSATLHYAITGSGAAQRLRPADGGYLPVRSPAQRRRASMSGSCSVSTPACRSPWSNGRQASPPGGRCWAISPPIARPRW